MTINRKSWHYRWLKFCGESYDNWHEYDDPVTLCGYFWSFWYYTARFIVLSLFLTFLALLIPLLLWSWFHNGSHDARNVLGLLMAAVGILIGIGLVIFVITEFQQSRTGFLKVCREFVKAKKKRFCPFIEYRSR